MKVRRFTTVIKIDPMKPDEEVIAQASLLLKEGEAIAFPTETVYGLGSSAFSKQGIKALYAIKNRPKNKAIPVMISNLGMLDFLVEEIPSSAKALMENFWPGPLTIIFPAKRSLSSPLLGGGSTVAIRYPDHPVPIYLMQKLQQPLAVTSANLSGNPAPKTAPEALTDIEGRIPLLIDGGRSPLSGESTIVDCTQNKIRIVRAGALSTERIQTAIP